MLIRQKTILSLIEKMSVQLPDGVLEKVSRIQLVKWAFLLNKEAKMPTFYQFVPYHYGPFSFTLYHELNALIRNSYIIESSNDTIQRTKDVAAPQVNSSLNNNIQDFARKYNSFSTEELINYVYSHYPWYTINAKEEKKRKEKRPIGKCDVYTVGYEGLQIDGFLDILLKAGIQQLIDVRYNPIARRYGFHKSTLSGLCAKLNIEYRHVRELGIPSEFRTNLQQTSDYEKLFKGYKKKVLDVKQDIVKTISDWVASKPSVLMCMEADPCFCHRSHIAEQIADHTKLMINHIRK